MRVAARRSAVLTTLYNLKPSTFQLLGESLLMCERLRVITVCCFEVRFAIYCICSPFGPFGLEKLCRKRSPRRKTTLGSTKPRVLVANVSERDNNKSLSPKTNTVS